jgi:hypothetical protein
MDLNTIALLFLGSILLYGAYQYWKVDPATVPKNMKTPWGEQVGRTKPIQSKTGDASMATEARRRQTIQGASCDELYKLKESRTTSGSATGAIETYFLTSICPARPKKVVCDFLFDGGQAGDDFCVVLDDEDGMIVYNGGNADTKVCGI